MANAVQPVQEMRHIAKLNQTNWGSWRYGISILLEKNKLNRVISREELRPDEVCWKSPCVWLMCVMEVHKMIPWLVTYQHIDN